MRDFASNSHDSYRPKRDIVAAGSARCLSRYRAGGDDLRTSSLVAGLRRSHTNINSVLKMTVAHLDDATHPCGPGDHHDHACPQAVLSVAFPAVQDIRGPEGLGHLWTGEHAAGPYQISTSANACRPAVFSKCKGSLQDGQRLENISWR